MPPDPRNALLDAIQTHNPWWQDTFDTTSLPARQKSDFYHLVRPDGTGTQFQDQPILGLVGRRGVGKTTLLKQFIAHELETGTAAERFCYLPFDADPLYQLQSDHQLRQAIRYYERRILGQLPDPDPHFVLLDDVHEIEHPTKPDVDGWATPVTDALQEGPAGRAIVVTASAGVQVRRELDRVDTDPDAFDVQPILPEKFRDYLYDLYPGLENTDQRLSPTSLRRGDASLPTAVRTGDPTAFVEELRTKHATVADATTRIRPQVVHYLAMGGVLAYDLEGAKDSAADLEAADYARLREDVRDALYQEVPGFETIQTIADLERVCALAARRDPRDPISYQDLVDLLDVDRRTVRDSYLDALATLYLLTPAVEYDNQRPRSVRLYLRDTGLATAFADGDATTVLAELDREAELATLAAYDHTMRFVYNTKAIQGTRGRPQVWYWTGREGSVDFVFELDDTPIPVGLAYRPGDLDPARAAVEEFRATYETPLGFLVTGDTVRPNDVAPVEYEDGIVTLPYWLYLMVS
ncbi:MAG: AAA family ATPase [Halobacteriaceae archaeon]